MSVEDQVDHLLNSNDRPQHDDVVVKSVVKSSSGGLLGFLRQFTYGALIGCLIATITFVPVYGGRNGLDVLQSFFDGNDNPDSLIPTGDPSGSWNWTIENDTVSINNSMAYLSATPHTLVDDGWVEFELESKQLSGNIDVGFGFNSTTAKPKKIEIWRNYTHNMTGRRWVEQYMNTTLWVTAGENLGMENYSNYDVNIGNENNTYLWNITYKFYEEMEDEWYNSSLIIAFESKTPPGMIPDINYTFFYYDEAWETYYYDSTFWDWKPFNFDYTVVNYDFRDADTWYLFRDIPIVEDVRYKIRGWIDIPFGGLEGSSGKYWWVMKPHNKDIHTAIQDGHFLYLDPWWDSNWLYRKTIVIDSTYVDGNLVNFPILFDNTSIDYQHAQANGDDFAFIAQDNTTQYNHEIEWFNVSGDNRLIAWVNITSLSGSSDTYLNLYYGNAGADNQENVADTWDSNFVGVWHMDSSANNSGIDSSCSDWYMTAVNTPHEETGLIGHAQEFDKEDKDYFDRVGDSSNWCENVTITAWWNQSNADATNKAIINRDYIYGDFLFQNANGITMNVFWGGNASFANEATALNPVDDIWYFTGVTRDNSTQKVYHYINDSLVETDDYTTWVYEASIYDFGLSIGVYRRDNKASLWNGTIDELRVSKINRSADWIATEYNTSFYKDDFITVGGEQSQVNNPPTQSGESPVNTSTDISVTPSLYVICTDADSDTMTATWRSNSSDAWVDFATNTSISTGTNITQDNSNFSAYSTTYYWSVNVSDGEDWSNETYHFTTKLINTSIDAISPYEQTTTPLAITVSGWSDLGNITLWYRYSTDNTTWSENHINWYTYGKNQTREGYTTCNYAPINNTLLWTANVTGSYGQYCGAVVVDGVVYISGKNRSSGIGHNKTVALYLNNGTEIWNYTTYTVDTTPTYSSENDLLFVQGDGRLAVDSSDNTKLWCIYPSNGTEKWNFSTYGRNFGYQTNPALDVENNLVITASNGNIWGIYQNNGTKKWNSSIGGNNGIVVAGAITYYNHSTLGGIVIKDTHENGIWCYYSNNGTLIWSNTTSVWDGWDMVPICELIDGQEVFFLGEYTGTGNVERVTCGNISTGESIWEWTHTPTDGDDSFTAMSYYDEKIYVGGTNDTLYCINATIDNPPGDRLIWQSQALGGLIEGKPVIANGFVYTSSMGSPNFFCLYESNGTEKWNYTVSGADSYSQPCISDGILLIGCDDWNLYAFGDLNEYNASISGEGWMIWSNNSNPDSTYPWQWNFTYPNGTGYYEFYSIGKKSGSSDEIPPSVKDTMCHYTYTAPWSNTAPTLTNEIPANTSTGISLYPQLNITVTDADGNNSNVYWYTNASGDWYLMQTNTSVLNTTVRLMNFTNASSYSTMYWWRVSANDTHDNITETYHFTTEAEPDTTPPTITINFAGNLSDSGGPYWRPPGESTALAGDWSDGYYTNDSRQSEGWMYINLTVEDSGGVPDVWLQWKNESTWTNYTYAFLNTTGGYFEFNTSGNISTAEGYNYSFDIVANDTLGNSKLVWWNKTDMSGGYGRRYVQLNCTPVNISYAPYYFYDVNYEDDFKLDRLWNDQGTTDATTDTGVIDNITPSDTMQFRACGLNVGWWFNDSICLESFTLNNIYFHIWWSSDDDNGLDGVGWMQSRGMPTYFTDFNDSYSIDVANNRSNIYYDNEMVTYSDDYHLDTHKLVTTPASFTDNNMYELLIMEKEDQDGTSICNRSITSFVIFNIPDNATLNASHADTDSDGLSDWTELYVNYTNPFLADTDNDGVSDYDETLSGSDPNNYTDTIPYITWQVIDSTVNGSYLNMTAFQVIDSTINGSYSNQTSFQVIDSTVNGSYSNTTVISWQTIDTTVNGSYLNVTAFQIIDSTINGSYLNTTMFQIIDRTINGSYSNQTSFQVIDSTVNGSYSNTTVISWQTIDTTVNGSYLNITAFYVIDSTVNGSYYNETVIWQIIDTTINGSYYNATAFQIIDSTINGSYSNITAFQVIDDTINGSYVNTTAWRLIDTTINGSYFNETEIWQTIDITINGSYSNTSIPWNVIDITINGSYTNTSIVVLSLTNEYPTNNSNIFSVQPTLYFMLVGPVGGMSYKLYIGNTNITTNYLLDSDTGLDNGTYFYVNFYNASDYGTSYWWRVHYNDSSTHVNETFNFHIVLTGGGMGAGGTVAGIVGVIGLFGLLGFFWNHRRKQNNKYRQNNNNYNYRY